MAGKRLKIGDFFRIPLPDGRSAFAQYILRDGFGGLTRIFDWVSAEPVALEKLSPKRLLFPPVYVGLLAALKEGRWQIVGNCPIEEDFKFPRFRFSFGAKPGIYHDWKIYDGKNWTVIGDLP